MTISEGTTAEAEYTRIKIHEPGSRDTLASAPVEGLGERRNNYIRQLQQALQQLMTDGAVIRIKTPEGEQRISSADKIDLKAVAEALVASRQSIISAMESSNLGNEDNANPESSISLEVVVEKPGTNPEKLRDVGGIALLRRGQRDMLRVVTAKQSE